MLNDIEKIQNKERFVELLRKLNFDHVRFVSYLDSPRVQFFEKPFNTHPEAAFAGSLCAHCLRVYDELVKLNALYTNSAYTEEQLIITALFKDLYRAELFEAFPKRQLNETTNQWETITAYRNKEQRPIFGDIGFSSYMIAKKFISLDDDEIVEAICYANLGNINTVDSYNIRFNYPLVTITLMAEIASLHF